MINERTNRRRNVNVKRDQATYCFQVKLLLKKNFYMLQRNQSSTLLQVAVGCFFLCLLFLINAGLNSNTRAETLLSEAKDLPIVKIPELIQCDPSIALGSPSVKDGVCYTFAFAPYEPHPIKRDPTTTLSNTVVSSIIQKYQLPMVNKKGGPIGFANEKVMLQWLLNENNQGRVSVGITFNNMTSKSSKDGRFNGSCIRFSL
jgi:hypothetical protein